VCRRVQVVKEGARREQGVTESPTSQTLALQRLKTTVWLQAQCRQGVQTVSLQQRLEANPSYLTNAAYLTSTPNLVN
jgi:hypothetical protein